MNSQDSITSNRVQGKLRLHTLPFIFGRYHLWVESMTFEWMRRLCESYNGGEWEFYDLSNGGFYMALSGAGKYPISSPNGFECEVSADAAGIIACLFCLCTLANRTEDVFLISKFHQLREFALNHSERELILAAIN